MGQWRTLMLREPGSDADCGLEGGPALFLAALSRLRVVRVSAAWHRCVARGRAGRGIGMQHRIGEGSWQKFQHKETSE